VSEFEPNLDNETHKRANMSVVPLIVGTIQSNSQFGAMGGRSTLTVADDVSAVCDVALRNVPCEIQQFDMVLFRHHVDAAVPRRLR
jgi:hypothetical protein